MTAPSAAVGVFTYFCKLKTFPRSKMISEANFEGKVPPVCFRLCFHGSDLATRNIM